MKLIIDIPEKVVTAIQNGEDYRYDIHTIIAQGIPYEERPQAKSTWRRVTDDENEFLWFRCMNCRQISYINSKYCPNCGCGMKGGAEE